MTLVPGELSATPRFSQQQQQILQRAVPAAARRRRRAHPRWPTTRSPRALGTDQKTVTTELEHLARSFGLSEMPFFERRAEIAMLALRSGLVKADE